MSTSNTARARNKSRPKYNRCKKFYARDTIEMVCALPVGHLGRCMSLIEEDYLGRMRLWRKTGK